MYPSLRNRYISSLIDGLILVFVVIVGTIAYQGTDRVIHITRIVVIFSIVLCYEPVLTSRLCTIGQAVTGVRVRQLADRRLKISTPRAFLRTLIKVLLGAYSFFAMFFSKHRRAVHDFAARSIVLEARVTRNFPVR